MIYVRSHTPCHLSVYYMETRGFEFLRVGPQAEIVCSLADVIGVRDSRFEDFSVLKRFNEVHILLIACVGSAYNVGAHRFVERGFGCCTNSL